MSSLESEERTFLAWVNLQLSSVKDVEPIKQFKTDFRSCVNIWHLASVLTKKPVPGKFSIPKNEIESKQLGSASLDTFLKDGCQLHGIDRDPSLIIQGDVNITRGFIWQLILHYQIKRGEKSSSLSDLKRLMASFVSTSVKNISQESVNDLRKLAGLESNDEPIAHNLSTIDSPQIFQSGLVLAALTMSLDPTQIDQSFHRLQKYFDEYKSSHQSNPNVNALALTDGSIRLAHDIAGIPTIISAADVVECFNANALLTYLSYFKQSDEDSETTKFDLKTAEFTPTTATPNKPLRPPSSSLTPSNSRRNSLVVLSDTASIISPGSKDVNDQIEPFDLGIATEFNFDELLYLKNENTTFFNEKDDVERKRLREQHHLKLTEIISAAIGELGKNNLKSLPLSQQTQFYRLKEHHARLLEHSSELQRLNDIIRDKNFAIAEATKEIEQCYDNIDQLETKVIEQGKEIDKITKELNALKEEHLKCAELHLKVESLTANLHTAQNQHEKLSDEKNMIEKELNHSNDVKQQRIIELEGLLKDAPSCDSIKDLEAKLSQLSQNDQDNLNKIEQLNKELSDASATIEKTIDSKQSELNAIEESLQAARSALDAANKSQNELQKDKEKLLHDALAQTKEIDLLRFELTALKSQIDQLENLVATLSEQQNNEGAHSKKFQQQIANLNDQINEGNDRLQTLQNESTEVMEIKNAAISSLQDQLANLKQQLEDKSIDSTSQLQNQHDAEDKLHQQIADLQQKLTILQKERDAFDTEVQQVKKTILENEQELQSLSANCKSKDIEIENLNEIVDQLNDEINTLKRTASDNSTKIKALEATSETATTNQRANDDKIKQLEDQLKQSQNDKAKLVAQSLDASEQNVALDKLSQQLDESTSRIAELEKLLQQAKDNSKDLSIAKEQAGVLFSTAKLENDKLSSQINDKDVEIQHLNDLLSNKDSQLDKVLNDNNSLSQKNEALILERSLVLGASQENQNELSKQLEALHQQITNQEVDIQKRMDQISSLIKQHDQDVDKLATKDQIILDNKDKIQNNQTQIDELQKDLLKAQNEFDNLKKDFNNLQEQLNASNELTKDLQENKELLSDNLKSNCQEIDSLQQKQQQLLNELDLLHEKLSAFEKSTQVASQSTDEELSKTQNENDTLRQNFAALEAQLVQTQAELAQLSNSTRDAQSDLTRDNENKDAQLKSVQAHRDALSDKLNELQNENKRLEQRIDDLLLQQKNANQDQNVENELVVKQLQNDKSALQDELSQEKNANKKSSQNNAELSQSLDDSTKLNDQLKFDNTALQKQLDDRSEAKENLSRQPPDDKNKALQEKNHKLDKQLEKATQTNTLLQKQLDGVNKQLDGVNKQLVEAQREANTAKINLTSASVNDNTVEDLTQALEDERKKNKDLEQQLKQALNKTQKLQDSPKSQDPAPKLTETLDVNETHLQSDDKKGQDWDLARILLNIALIAAAIGFLKR